jgi:WD40 repeat protein
MDRSEGGYDVFLSYQRRDATRVKALARALRKHRIEPFLGLCGPPVGLPWVPALESALSRARAVGVCIGPGDLGPWQQREVHLALNRQAREPTFPVIPILLPGADPVLGFLGQNTWIDLREAPDDRQLIAALAHGIRGEPPDPGIRDHVGRTVAGVSPYRGLQYFREEDAPFFFGRSAAVEQLGEAIRHTSFVALVGASGSGKSSVVRAGLISALRRDEEHTWEMATLVPGDRPLHALAAALLPLLEADVDEIARLAETNRLASAFERREIGLRDVAERILAKQPGTDRLLLVVDQWEEIYTLTAAEATRRQFIDELLEAASRAPLSVVLTLRGDFVGHVLAYRPLSDRLQDAQVNLGPMTRAELAVAIERPAEKVGLSFEHALVARILDDAGEEPGNLPLLEFVLKRLWEHRSNGLLLHDEYDRMGRIQGAVARRADEIFGQLTPQEQLAVQRIFLQLAIPADEGAYARRRAALEEIGEGSRELLKKLTDERLLVTSPGATGGETVEVSHEALIRNWDTLKNWLDQDREFLLWRRRFAEFVTAWRRDRAQEGTLLTGAFLVEAQKWLSDRGERLVGDERNYINESLARRERDRRRARFRRRAIVAVVGAAGIIATLFGLDSQRQKRRAEAEATGMLALRLAAQARQKAATNIVEGLLLGVAAVDTLSTDETEDNLLWLLRSMPDGIRAFHWGHTASIWNLSFSPDGGTIATAGKDGAVFLWDAVSGKLLGAPLTHRNSELWGVAFRPDGKVLATAASDGSLTLWDVSSRKPLGELEGPAGGAWTVDFSPDGKLIASGGKDGTVVLWESATGRRLGRPLKGHTDEVWATAFAPDGATLATAGNDHSIILWDVATRTPIGSPLRDHTAEVWSLAFSPDGRLLASGGDDEVVLLWDVATRKVVGEPLRGHTGEIWSVAFSPDGATIATASWDRTVILWDVATRRPLRAPLEGHLDAVTAVAFSPDGDVLATASHDRTMIRWEAATRGPTGVPLTGHRGQVLSAAFSPDETMFATGGDDESVLLWDISNHQRRGAPLVRHTDEVWAIAFSPDGRTVATGSRDRTVVLWDVATNKPIGEPLTGHADEVLSVAFHPAGVLLASGGDDGTVILWNRTTLKQVGELKGPLGEIRALAFSPDGTTLAASWDRRVLLWDVESRKTLVTLMRHTDTVLAVAFSPDGKRLATGSRDRTVILWNPVTGEPVGEPLKRHTDEVFSLAFDREGREITTAGRDGLVIHWDIDRREPVGEPFSQGTGEIALAVLGPRGHQFVTADREGAARLWEPATTSKSPEPWKSRVCDVVNRNFTTTEWRRYMADRPYRKICSDASGPGEPWWPLEN